MKEQFIISGEKPLNGEVNIRGSKNAATPILAATLLTDKPCVIDNIPLIEDVFRMIEIIEGLGAEVEWINKRKVRIEAKNIDPKKLNIDIVRKLRSSILFLSPLLIRCKKITLPTPGGCVIGARPLNTHLEAIAGFGVNIKTKKDKYSFELPDSVSKKDHDLVLKEFSVTATENVLMFASALSRKTNIRLAACEPHVQDLAKFLVKMGADIEGIGTHYLTVNGKNNLFGAQHTIVPDYIEAGTFLIAIAATRGKATVKDIIPGHIEAILYKLEEMGVKFQINKKKDGFADITVYPSKKMIATRIQTLPFPGLPTDIQAPFGVLATQSTGTSLIHDPLYEGRLRYVSELNKMGANCILADAHRAFIIGPTPLYGNHITSFDIRAGATLYCRINSQRRDYY
jgi:UDP-N-acetylglucosamine 1-carboxyvinyltransferase